MNIPSYTPADKMATLIVDNYQLIQVMSRFGVKVGFGDDTVEEVCQRQGVDCATFLAVVNFIADDNTPAETPENISVKTLMTYLKNSHTYFLEYCLPAIRRKLLDGITMRTSDVSFLILKFFDEYMHEVRVHMEYEDRTVFRYVADLLEGNHDGSYEINIYSAHHEQAADKLKELKSIIIKYCPEDADVNLLNDALYDIYRTEKELESHCLVEDRILVPAIRRMENESMKKETPHGKD